MWRRRPRVRDLEPGDRCRLTRRGHLWTVQEAWPVPGIPRTRIVVTRPPNPGDPDPSPIRFATHLPHKRPVHDLTKTGVRA